jgi:hypothetical protein
VTNQHGPLPTTAAPWADLVARFETADSALLIGNGASVAVWDGFAYGSLYDKAVEAQLLSVSAQRLFAGEDRDFEAVLRDLYTAERLAKTLGQPTLAYVSNYSQVRDALAKVVAANHVPWNTVTDTNCLKAISDALVRYGTVVSTNYDLLVYWATQDSNQDRFRNAFWSGDNLHYFDPLDTDIRGDATGVYWLHGGLHLQRTWSGMTRKRSNQGLSLLSTFGTDPDGTPLIVSEGSPAQKLSRIEESAYLLHSYRVLASHRPALTVFGSALNPASDGHILAAIKAARPDRIAVSLHRPDQAKVAALWGRLRQEWPDSELVIFDASTHPLGQPPR